ncbi:MAG: molybdopterin-dependent oxidoreductase [Coriobacteriia bacterium]|nr:molybdopterin-dependent oxidoreductase [Coriobacteriia bacterium]
MAGGVLSKQDWLLSATTAEAADVSSDETEALVPTTCNSCSNKCGLIINTKGGRLWRVLGNADHPYNYGTVCARGQGFAQVAYSPDRLTSPMKRNDDGSFTAISWDQAYQEIGDKLKTVLSTYGPGAVAMINDPRPSGSWYSSRFIASMGSANYYTHNVACDGSRSAGFIATFGAASYTADINNAKMVVFIGRSYADGLRPTSARWLADASARGAQIVYVDPRNSITAQFATQWLPINAGTDLALLLAVANILITEDLYDHNYVENYTLGFDDWVPTLTQYTADWAAGITGIDADTITQLARDLGAAGHAGVIEQGWHAACGCQYQNSFETGRCIAAINALLGNFNQEGGALFYPAPSFGALDPDKFIKTPAASGPKAGLAEYPLQNLAQGIANVVPKMAKDGTMKACFFYNSNAAKGYSNPVSWADGLRAMDLSVDIDIMMSETAMQCDYVLPECSALERAEVSTIVADMSPQPIIDIRFQALDVLLPDTKPGAEIFTSIAQAAGLGDYFTFTSDELIKAQLATLNIDYNTLQTKGVLPVGNLWSGLGTYPTLNTPSGMFEFASQKIANNTDLTFHTPLIRWIPPMVTPGDGQFRLIAGKQSVHSHTMTTVVEALMDISREYNLERIWIPASRAADLGIADGDLVEVSNDLYTKQVEAHVTERLNPGCVWIPSHYGGTSPYNTQGYLFGCPQMDFVKFQFEDEVGCPMSHETLVSVKKVNA